MEEKNSVDTIVDSTKRDKKKFIITFIAMQLAFFVLSFANVFSKMASGQDFLSFYFILFYGLQICILGVYAIVWQQIIKRMQLSIAYANKAITLLWAMVWSILIFTETITLKNIIGVAIVMLGIVIVNIKEK